MMTWKGFKEGLVFCDDLPWSGFIFGHGWLADETLAILCLGTFLRIGKSVSFLYCLRWQYNLVCMISTSELVMR